MKICILANALSVHTQRWAKAFAQRGNEVHIVSIRYADIPGVNIHPIHFGIVNSKNPFNILLSYLRLLFNAKFIIKKISPDVVNAHYALTHGVIAAFANQHPLVVSVWGSDVIWDEVVKIPSFMKIFLKYAFKKVDAICVTSQFMKNYVLPVSPKTIKLHHIPFGIDCDLFVPQNKKENNTQITIGYIKTMEPLYGPQILIQAMLILKKELPNIKLIMVGSDKTNGEIKRLAEKLNVLDNIEFAGFVQNEKVPQILNSFDIFVHPSICTESFGVSILEASACGCPVVATRVGGVPEVCIDGQTGILVEPNNPDALADAIIKLAKNPQLRNNMGKAGRNFVVNNYDWNKNVQSMLQLMQDTISNYKK